MDIKVHDQGSVVGFEPITQAAQDWIEANVHAEGWQWLGNVLWCERRYAADLFEAATSAGLEVRR